MLENTAQIVSGEMMAGTDIFDLEFIGRGGYGAHPHTCIDPIIMATQFVNNTQSVVSKRLASYETNDEKAALIARKAFAKVLGEENIIVSSKPDMGAKDFAFLTRERMGSMYLLEFQRI
ncbi:amidohydrolase [Campylobacter jejuni subsp. doylei]|nr:amidohydrolase [Campylobacter jejuni subsp. doylei]